MSSTIFDIDFSKEFHTFEALMAVDQSLCSENLLKKLAKLAFGKIIVGKTRLIPLKNNLYAQYQKDTCILDDEACNGAYSDHKTLKIMHLTDPKSNVTDSPKEVVCHTWYYNLENEMLAKLGMKIHTLAFEFLRVFPKIVPHIHELQFLKTPKDFQIRIFQDKWGPSAFKIEARYEIDTYEDFENHLLSIYDLLCKLYKAEMAHGDLNMRNMILDNKGMIKTLVDFDMASSIRIQPARYIRCWVADIRFALQAMLFHQQEISISLWDPHITLPKNLRDYAKIQMTVDKIFGLFEHGNLEIFESRFLSDFADIPLHRLKSFQESQNPEKIFRHVFNF